jgi:hypothetical protein
VRSFKEYFKNSIELIQKSNIDYLIIGAIAVGVWGKPRVTEDLDLIIFISKKEVNSLLDNAKRLEFQFDEEVVLTQVKQKGVFKLFYDSFHLDFIIASTQLEKTALNRKIAVKIYDKEVFVPSKEDLILFKIIPGRPQDLVDIENIIIRHRDNLDVEYLKQWAQRLCDEAEDMRIWNKLTKLLG